MAISYNIKKTQKVTYSSFHKLLNDDMMIKNMSLIIYI